MKKQSSLTLIEVLVGFTLFGILMGVMMTTFVFVSRTKHKYTLKHTFLQKKRVLAHTISTQFDKLENNKIEIKKHEMKLTTKGNIDRDPHFFGLQKVRFYLEDNTLYMESKSHSQPSSDARKIPLAKEVKDIQFLPIGPSKKSPTLYSSNPDQPAAIQLFLTFDTGDTLKLAFLIPPDLTKPIELESA